MDDTKIKRYTFLSILFGGVSLLCLIAFLGLLVASEGNPFAIKPTWLGFLLLVCFGVGLMLCCVFVYLVLRIRCKEEMTLVCPKCGAYYFLDDAFCATCGERLSKDE